MKGTQAVLTKVDNGWVVSIIRRPGSEDFGASTYIAHTLSGACSMLMADLENGQDCSNVEAQWGA
jgi:hypothetical protein